MGAVENRTQRMTNTLGTHFDSLSRITRNFTAGFAILATIRFGENIIQNFDKITATAREYGVAIDQSVILKMNEAEVATTRAWTNIQVAAAPALASISTGLANIVSNLFGIPGDLDRLTNSLRAAQSVAERGAGTSAGRAAAGRVSDLQAQIAALQEPENQRIANLNFTGSSDMQEKIRKENLQRDEDNKKNVLEFTSQQLEAQKKINEVNAAGTEKMRQQILDEHKADNDAILLSDQDLARQQLEIDNENFAATEEMRQKILQERTADADAVAKFQDEQGRRTRQLDEQLRRSVIGSIADFGDTMEQAGGKFGKAVEMMLLDITKLIVKLEITKALESSLGGGGGGGFFGALLSAIGLGGASAGGGVDIGDIPGRAVGGPVSAGALYRVNEGGTEIFQPNVPGTIYPHGTGPGGGGDMHFQINVNGARGNAEIREMVSAGVQQGISTYDRHGLPGRVSQLVSDPGTYRLRR